MNKRLFIHGWATDNAVWEGVATALSSDRGRALLPNLPGHGNAARWLEPSLNPAMASVAKLLSAEKGPVTGLGWSMGAQILLSLVARSPEKFSAIVLIGPTPCFTERADFAFGQSKALVRRMIMDMKQDPEATLKRFYPLNFTEQELGSTVAASFMERYLPPGPIICENGDGERARGSACRQAFNYRDITMGLEALNNTDIRRLLGQIKTPTLIVHGKADSVVQVEAGEYLANNITGAEMEVFDSAGHAPFITEQEKFIKVVEGFLRNLEG